eukprot:CAMPEP_0172521804 /NCGR_PEP_ID=MMETSP1066-20121228/292788_1 /TAXON_ID=671091 /ORGANISM="Coscinodiscus wailesii, Strain CCMP2513" /LENGTH=166 /DNA_ID=CAMNT_0013304763 /DNA_START=907 /DNA_END=1404 /DNA_ORIENTATION=-
MPLNVAEAKELTSLLNKESIGTFTAASSMITSLTPTVSDEMSSGMSSQARKISDGVPNGFQPMPKGFSFRSLDCTGDSDDGNDSSDKMPMGISVDPINNGENIDDSNEGIPSINALSATTLQPLTSITLEELKVNDGDKFEIEIMKIYGIQPNQPLSTIANISGVS